MKRIKILSVVGARPNFVKIAPFCHEISKYPDEFQHTLLHTGQHTDYNMSKEFFELLDIPEPDIHLAALAGSHAVQTADIIVKFEKACIQVKPDWVVVVGDVNSTLACALTAKKSGVRVAHIEAGLRSFDMTMPEEINRKIVDAISDILFASSEDACAHLRTEGVDPSHIEYVGNILIDTLCAKLPVIRQKRFYSKWDIEPKKFVFATLHRPSNVDDPENLNRIIEALGDITGKVRLLFSIHPRTLNSLQVHGLLKKIESVRELILTGPVSYHESISLIDNAAAVITDSGGIQEESAFLNVPCLTLRPNTERPVTIHYGTNKLTTVTNLQDDIEKILAGIPGRPQSSIPLWDGKTAQRIVDVFRKMSGQ